MHSYCNKVLSNPFDDYFIPISSNHSHSTRLSTCFYLELTLPQENVPLHLLAQTCTLQYRILNGNLRNTYRKKIHNYVL